MSLLKDSSAMDPASASAASTSLGQVPSAGASSRGRQGWHRALRHRSFVLGAVLTMLMLGMAAISLVWTPWSPYEVDLAAKLQPPSAAHWLGTDAFGRDILSLLMVGARNSILVGVIAVGIGMGVGTALGLLAAARKGWVEEAIMRLADFTFAFPALLLAIMLTAVFGAGIVNSIIAIGIFYIPTFARVTRASANAVWAREYILAARACGKGPWRITLEHVLPNILSVLIVQATIQFALAILAVAGVGVQRHIGHHAQVGEFFLQGPHHARNQAIGVARFLAVGRLERGVNGREQRHHRNAQLHAICRHRQQQVQAQALHAGHGAHGFAALHSLMHKHGVDQVVDRHRMLTHQAAREGVTAQAAGAVLGEGGRSREVHGENCALSPGQGPDLDLQARNRRAESPLDWSN